MLEGPREELSLRLGLLGHFPAALIHSLRGVHLEALLRSGAVLSEAPAVDRLDVEAPIAADLERRQLTVLELAVNRRRMNPEVVRQFPYGHYPAIVWFHFIGLSDFLMRGCVLLPCVGAVDFAPALPASLTLKPTREQVGQVRMIHLYDRSREPPFQVVVAGVAPLELGQQHLIIGASRYRNGFAISR
jgi:hypothetical protein